MKNSALDRKLYFKIPVLLLVFGFFVIGNLNAQTDSRLNGRWVSVNDDIESELLINNANYQQSLDGLLVEKGTFTARNGDIIFNATHVFGGLFDLLGISGLESKWYTINEFIIAVRPLLSELGLSDSQITELVDDIVSDSSDKYSVDGNTLIIISDDQMIIYNKK